MPNYQFFATTPKAMEDMLADELRSLGAANVKTTIAGAYFTGDLALAYRICLWSRIANRVLLQLSTFRVNSQDDLYQAIKKINWHEHLEPNGSFAVTFNAKHSEVINNTHFGALKVKDAIVDQMRATFQQRPSIALEQPDIRINVNLNGDSAVLSLDLSGESLHRRGYRDTTIKAPIKENLAAALLVRSGWQRLASNMSSLLDPMCGSGTLLVEGALIAADYAPGLLRDYFGFKGWKGHDVAIWRELLKEAFHRKTIGLSKLPTLVGYDLDRRNISAALTHINKAGLQHKIHVECRDITDAAPAKSWQPGLLICNPPYGERLGDEEDTAELYQQFGNTLKRSFSGWTAAIIISNPELGFRLGIRSQKPVTFFNGALECKLLRMRVEERNFFIPKAKSLNERFEQINALTNKPILETHSKANAEATDQLGHEQTSENVITPSEEHLPTPKSEIGAPEFANRLQKNIKKLAAWRTKNNIHCYRAYDADLPDYAVAIDVYQGDDIWVNVQEYEPPKTIDPHKANQRLAAVLNEIPKVLGIPPENIFLKVRRKQKSSDQYQKLNDGGQFHIVQENGCRLQVNFSDYLDTGLFLDHRPIRLLLLKLAKNKRFLNLFAYTGSATVHAAVGGATATTTVDMSKTYLDWAKTNLSLNTTIGQHEFIQADCLEWLEQESNHPLPKQYDLIFLDPPTFSNSKRMDDVFDIQKNHVSLLKQAAQLLAPNGLLFFSTNFRRFKLEEAALSELIIEDIRNKTIPEDFSRNPKIHQCWQIKRA